MRRMAPTLYSKDVPAPPAASGEATAFLVIANITSRRRRPLTLPALRDNVRHDRSPPSWLMPSSTCRRRPTVVAVGKVCPWRRPGP